MSAVSASLVYAVRRFNRFYTNILGLLDKSMLHSGFSLPESRILYELFYSGGQSAKQLAGRLVIDSGYFSRLIKSLEAKELVERVPSIEDRRSYLLFLTDKGRETFLRLDSLSDSQITGLIEKLSDVKRERLALGIASVE